MPGASFKGSNGYRVNLDWIDGCKPGDPPPEGYNDWHAWADVQVKAGLRQEACAGCSLYKFPQELSGEQHTMDATDSRGNRVQLVMPVCSDCATTNPTPPPRNQSGAATRRGE